VARVYRELERDGVIETSPGRGSFIRADGSATGESRRMADDVAQRTLADAVREARSLGLNRRDVEAVMARLLDRWYPPSESLENS
jgi:DNA-binding transcriptional regulator YhcF (GntR family)